jgi:hypothetical protein
MILKMSIKTLSPIKMGRILKPALDKAMASAKPKIAALIIERIEAQASKSLSRMANRYKQGLNKPESIKITPTSVEVVLLDPVAAVIESGGSAYDIKKVMMKGAKSSSRKGIPFIDVPFTHAAGDVPSGMRKAIARKAAAAGGGTRPTQLTGNTPGRKFTRTLHRRVLGVPFGTKKQKVTHKQGIHDNLIRHGSGGSVGYQTIRRISANSAPSSWWHPGFRGLKLLQKVVPPLKDDIMDIMRDSLRAAGIPTK